MDQTNTPSPSGSLIVIGTGIRFVGDLTLAAKGWIEQADKVLFAVADPASAHWLRTLNPAAEALPYGSGPERRKQVYQKMVERILAEVRLGQSVCAIFYGHPGVLVDPSHEAIRQARREGFKAQMLAGVSAEDWLYADLGFDPVRQGCQSFEATDFLIRRRKFDPTAALILWQITMIGNRGFETGEYRRGLVVLAEVLAQDYDPDHEVVVYDAAVYPVCEPIIQRLPLARLPEAQVTPVSTLYVPPRPPLPPDPAMLARLGLGPS